MATSWLPGASPGRTSRSTASGQVSLSHSHVFMMVFISFSHASGDWRLRGYWEGLRSGGMLGGCYN